MKLVFAGDIAFNYIKGNYPGKDAVKYALKEVLPVFETADFRMINLENPLCDKACEPIPKSGPNLISETSFVEYLKELKIDLAGMANNHTGDYGDTAIIETMKCLDENNISHIGAGANIEEAYKAYRFEKEGIKVSIIACCENEFGVADDENYGVAGFELGRVVNTIKEEKKVSEYVIFNFHGGNEQNPFPSPKKCDLYRHLIDIGADAVIAMHTHCPQGYEIHNGKPIVYSMGNFYFPELNAERKPNEKSAWFFGYISELDVTASGIELKIHPYRFSNADGCLYLLNGESLEKFMAYMEELCAPIADHKRIKDLFNIWSTMAGPRYSWTISFKNTMTEKGGASAVCHLRNSFVCEAHSEMLAAFTEVCYKEQFAEYAARQEEITRYQEINI